MTPQISKEKYTNAILFLAQHSGGKISGKKKLAKLLYFVDFDLFEKEERSLTNDKYLAYPMGPFPSEMESMVKEMTSNDLLSVESVQTGPGLLPTEVYRANSVPDMSVFSEDEIFILQRVADKYGDLSGKQLEDLSHAEAPYIATEPFQEITYELAFYRDTDFENNG